MKLSPIEIEEKSMRIIESKIPIELYSEDELLIVKKIIHTTADFSLRKNIVFKEGVIKKAVNNIKSGKDIVTDVFMVKEGISPFLLKNYKGALHCFIREEKVQRTAEKEGITRAEASVRYAFENLKNIGIFAVGNAPTAIFEILRLNKKGMISDDLVVLGFCVGMVGAKEAKKELLKSDIPAILLKGNRGGSPLAATTLNGLLKLAFNK